MHFLSPTSGQITYQRTIKLRIKAPFNLLEPWLRSGLNAESGGAEAVTLQGSSYLGPALLGLSPNPLPSLHLLLLPEGSKPWRGSEELGGVQSFQSCPTLCKSHGL